MSDIDVTVVVVPRERFSAARESLEAILATTPQPYRLIYVDAGSPGRERRYLERAAKTHGFLLLRSDQYLSPNEARNAGLRHVRTPYVVFIDNDAIPSEGWLPPLVQCARETGAWVVGPMYCETRNGDTRIHMLGGTCRIEQSAGSRVYVEKHHLPHVPLHDVKTPLERTETELIEFHAVLVDTASLARLGPLDEQLLGRAEHGDFCLAVRGAGGRIFIEPASVVTYPIPPRLPWLDRDYFLLRRCDAWNRASLDRLISKHQLHGPGSNMQNEFDWSRQFMYTCARISPRWLKRILGTGRAQRLADRLLSLEIRCRSLRWTSQLATPRPVPGCRVSYDPQQAP